LFTLAYGLYNFLKTENPLIVLGSLLMARCSANGGRSRRVCKTSGSGWSPVFGGKQAEGPDAPPRNFVRGFLTASLVFCVGPMTILGSIQDGLKGDYSLLAIKSVLDGFAALAFASTLGAGVLFSVIVILFTRGHQPAGGAVERHCPPRQ